MDARLLASMDPQPFKEVPDLSPQPQLTNPESSMPVQPGPVGAKYLAEPQPMPPMPSGPSAESLAAQSQYEQSNGWTPERKAFAKKVNDTAKAYKAAVEGRRSKRGDEKGYSKIKGQLDAVAGSFADLDSMQKTYAEAYPEGSPAKMALQKQQAHYMEKMTRLRAELNHKAQLLHKKYGLPLGKNGGLQDEDSLDAQGDAQFDDEIRQGYTEALMAQPPQ